MDDDDKVPGSSGTAPAEYESRLVAEPAQPAGAPPATPRCPIRWARRSTTPRNSRASTSNAVIKDLHALMTDSQEWWPADFGHYGGAVHPHGLAQRRHLSHRRRPRRRRRRPAALRAAQQLAGQRQPRQGAPAAVADQAEIRPQDLLGRPDDPRRQRRARIDGLQDLRLRRRPRRCLGARRDIYWGPEGTWLGDERYSGERELAEPARRRADGPDLRQSGRPERQSRSGRLGARTSARPSPAWR